MAMRPFRSRGSTGREPQEWAVVWGLYTQQEPHEQEVLCFELLRMPAQRINRYLLQLVYLAVCRPCGPLERAVTQLCGRSFNIAVQVSWLLLALLQDQPWNRHIYQFREACERAVLTGDMGDEQLHLSPFLEQSLQDCFPQQLQPEPSHILQPLQQPNQLSASWGCSRPCMLTNRLAASTSSPPSPSVAAVMASSPSGHSPGAGSFCALSSSSSGAHRFRSSLDLELMRHVPQDRAPSPALAGTPAASVGCGPAVAAVPEAEEAAGVADPGTFTAATAKCCGSDKIQQAHQQQPAATCGGLAKQLAASPAGCSQGSNGAAASGSAALADEGQCTAAASTSSEINSGAGASSCSVSQPEDGSAAAASCCGSFEEYMAARRVELQQELGEGEGVSGLIAASHEFAQHCGHQGLAWIVTHEEDLPELLSGSALLARPPACPEHAAVRDSYLATLDFVEALCETSSNLTRFAHDQRRKVLRQCLARISMEVEAAAEQGVAVRYPIGGCCKRVLRLLANDAAILNSRDKAPFLLLLEVQHDSSLTDNLTMLHDTTHDDGAWSSHSSASYDTGHSQAGTQQRPQRRQPQHLPKQQQQQRASQLSMTSAECTAAGTSAASDASMAAGAMPVANSGKTDSYLSSDCNSEVPNAVEDFDTDSQQQQQQQQQQELASSRSEEALLSTEQQQQEQDWGKLNQQQQQQQQQQEQQQEQQHQPQELHGQHTPLELQMHEAAAILRGDKLVRLQLNVLNHCAIWQLQQPMHLTGAASISQQQSQEEQEDAADALWLFGEVPASSSTDTLARAASVAFHSGSASPWSAQTAEQGCEQHAVQVVLEVLAGPPVVPQLSKASGALRIRRRLPSQEAIDIIAGKLGQSVIPQPVEIGPPLRLSGDNSSTSSLDGEADRPGSSPRVGLLTAKATATAAAGSASGSGNSGSSVVARSADGSSFAADAAAGTANSAATAAGGDAIDGEWQDISGAGEVHQQLQQQQQQQNWPLLQATKQQMVQQHANRQSGIKQLQDQQRQQQPAQQQQQQQSPARGGGLWNFLHRPFGSGQQEQQPVISLSLEEEKQAAAAAAAAAAERSKRAAAVFGERLSDRAARVAAASSYSSRPGWQLRGVIVKSGDDCRQELLALQLIREFRDIWAAAGIPLWALPFEVLVTSNNTALIQLIADATSIHTIKARASTALASTAASSSSSSNGRNLPHGAAAATAPAGSAGAGTKGCVSLSDHFFAMWPRGTPECLAAQRRFVESLAGYSLIMHLLQVKDRHNGNIMMDDQGHLIHIDFGFILSNAPGGNWVRFEASPMKLTRELLEVMDSNSEGQPSDLFDYFKVLCIQGFLAARKERSRIVGLVQIMAQCCQGGPLCPSAAAGVPRAAEDQQAKSVSGEGAAEGAGWRGVGSHAAGASCSRPWPCFKAGPDKVVAALESRFMPGLSEGACVQHVLRLISSSLDAWSTRQYDYYQRVLNGIL